MSKHLLVISTTGSGNRGATHVLEDNLVSAYIPEWIVQSMSPVSALEFIQSGISQEVVVFVQQEGGLSLEYLEWAEAVLTRGGRIVELNVFNLPSRFRPVHRNYVMAVYSREGELRYRLRSVGQRSAKRTRLVVLPNVVNRVSGDRGNRVNASELRLLRVGRPNPGKWSLWEIEFGARLAREHPTMQIVLTLVGAPPGLALHANHELPLNLEIVKKAYHSDVSMLYAQHDVYCHYSTIGETYGNTFAEAQHAGLFVVAATDAHWDFAPREFLDPRVSLVATRRWILRNTDIVVEKIQVSRQSGAVDPREFEQMSASQYLLMLTTAHKTATPCPAVSDSFVRLRSNVLQIRGLRLAFVVPVWELLRGMRKRVMWLLDSKHFARR